MVSSYADILAPVGAVAINVACQIIVYRLFSKVGFVASLVIGFLAGLIAVALSVVSLHAGSDLELSIVLGGGFLTYAALSYCFFGFANLGESAIRIRLLRELAARPDGMTGDLIRSGYNDERVLALRLDRLLSGGQIRLRDGRYRVSGTLIRLLTAMIVTWKLVALGKRSEFDRQ